ncbi:hypothetical protein BDF20DRAFT_895190 [Mycotypha africana]|uniref:uncharacterized protein n=1 Tax=Mycotypha africana TaxID=64632 RepID=UPI002301EE19|nr:uncharacterized protein BDF20DRAFT_895190 [Mycotypha africana]KAI8968243.1 hypothetical protein BDF20DRAFT_895190 [Mycotypha africana]
MRVLCGLHFWFIFLKKTSPPFSSFFHEFFFSTLNHTSHRLFCPLLPSIFCLSMNSLKAFNAFYNRCYNKRPILTLCVANGILGAISDSLAQSITLYNSHHKRQQLFEEDRYLPDQLKKHKDLWTASDQWDFKRTFRFAAYNFCVAPLGGKWYMFLDKFFPMPVVATAASKVLQQQAAKTANKMAIKRMITDQALFAPAGLVLFFTVMGLAETGGRWEGVREKFRDAYAPALIANYKVWPAVQFINFKFMPLPYRLPFVSTLGIVWNAYLSWLNNASKQEESVLESLQKNEKEGLQVISPA